LSYLGKRKTKTLSTDEECFSSWHAVEWLPFTVVAVPSTALLYSFSLDWHRQVWNQSTEGKNTHTISNVSCRR